MKTLKNKTALITGASSGIGEAFAYELAKQGVNLIITARSEDKLQILAHKISKEHNVQVTVFTGDLLQKDTPQKLYNQIKQAGLSVDLLVNNAGFGKWVNFLDESMEDYDEMIEININALVKLCHLVLPDMLKKGDCGIINVASTGALQPCPYVATYCASKSFVLDFSEALYGEYSKRGVTITALCPGNTTTGFQSVAKANTKGMAADTPETVAKQGISALLKNKSFKIVGTTNYLQSFLPRLLPRKAVINIVSKMMNAKVNG
ncbi:MULTISPECIES: SDR family NAD(P)-dependent oxidoreductase [unclassified Flavobacterium]|uniref:SDR family NAD(P)-dependent oxidoreductase n=1 Tax=unclassified Flavobacterium TaxID=196869 RepID=UPI00057EC6D3|nr:MULTISPECIES: SDR family oxidoreductase [unclassified Flavobacterium]KIA94441.1 short-chain dehydrogenase [Flavobacterium sp. KMS]KIC00789.1 short-chain dehydrogenase [Flavobacterium sp. JRM]MEA9415366.1 SDR family oxidoreductase [Flavobacterium sp. PL02]